ncbi:MAG TPA: hypothetical protein PK395_06170 [bacterium]|nr:hypothetical protein [bacterium]HQP98161.1 hypothetical protein [bacterium]
MRSFLRKLFRNPILMDYGMLVVLIVVSLFLSWATYREGEAIAGPEGGKNLAESAAGQFPGGVFIVISSEDNAASSAMPDSDSILKTLTDLRCTVAAVIPAADSLPGFRRGVREVYRNQAKVDGIILVDSSRERWLRSALRGLETEQEPAVILPVRRKESVFLKQENLVNIVRQASVIAIIAAGMTMVIITGGIDLSVGSLVAFSGVVTALCLKQAGGVPLLGLIVLILFFSGMGGFSLGMVFGKRGWGLLAGVAVAMVLAFLSGKAAQNHVLGIRPVLPATVEAVKDAAQSQAGGLFLFYDGAKPGTQEFVKELKQTLATQTDIPVVGERSVLATDSISVEEAAKEAAEEILGSQPDLKILFGMDRDIHSGLNRAIDAVGATERLVAVRAVTDKTGLVTFAVAVGVLVGCVGGATSGVVITGFGIPPFIATLAMMLVARGISRYLCSGVPIWDLPEEFEFIGNGYLFQETLGNKLPVPVAVMILVFLVGHFVLSDTQFGRYLYAVGGNEEATRLSGIQVNAVKFFAYVITGGLSAVAGVIMAARLQCGHPETGALYELYVIAACVVGGTSLMGGQGKILGSLIGALLIWVIFNGLNLLYVDSYLQQAILGLVIFVAVLLDQAKKRLSG